MHAPTGGMLASLAAGNAVACKPAPGVERCSELVVETIDLDRGWKLFEACLALYKAQRA